MTNIKINHDIVYPTFGSLEHGQFFLYNNGLYLKLDDISKGTMNALHIGDKQIYFASFSPSMLVTLVNRIEASV